MRRTAFVAAAFVVCLPLAYLLGERTSAEHAAAPRAAAAAMPAMDDHDPMAPMAMMGDQGRTQGPAFTPPANNSIPPADPYVDNALKTSPRHGEWVDVKMPDGPPLKAFIVYPEKAGKSGVVIVIHEIFGMTPWVQGVADQLAKDGFIAIAPDLLSGKGPNGGGTDSLASTTNGVRQAIAGLTPADRAVRLDAVMAYGKSIPSSDGRTGVVGFCWGGGTSLLYAIAQPTLDAAVMYYGPAPTVPGTQTLDLSGLPKIHAPILALYPGTDARTADTAAPISAEMKTLGKSFDYHIYDGATHGFMHQRSAADYQAATASWPLVLKFFRAHLK